MCEFYSKLGLKQQQLGTNVFGPNDKLDLERSHVLGANIMKVINSLDGETINVWGSVKQEEILFY